MFFLFGESVSSLRVKQLSYLNVIKNSWRIQLHLQPVLLSYKSFFKKYYNELTWIRCFLRLKNQSKTVTVSYG